MATSSITRRKRTARQKISTTISAQTLQYLERAIKSGEAANLAEAIDLAIRQLREEEWRREMDAKVSAYYDSLSDEEVEEERGWGEFSGESFARQEQ